MSPRAWAFCFCFGFPRPFFEVVSSKRIHVRGPRKLGKSIVKALALCFPGRPVRTPTRLFNFEQQKGQFARSARIRPRSHSIRYTHREMFPHPSYWLHHHSWQEMWAKKVIKFPSNSVPQRGKNSSPKPNLRDERQTLVFERMPFSHQNWKCTLLRSFMDINGIVSLDFHTRLFDTSISSLIR